METRIIIRNILGYLKENKMLPKNIQKTIYKSLFFYNIFDSPIGEFIYYNVATGIDSNEETALLKALVEHMERISLNEANKNFIFGDIRSSDGYAAYPTAILNYRTFARDNALSEATERFVWSFWWDYKTKSNVAEIDLNKLDEPTSDLLKVIVSERQITKMFEIVPNVIDPQGRETIIIFAKMKNGGYLSGGACGTSRVNTRFRAASEIIRHHLAFDKYEKQNLSPKTFYEERLVHFANGDGNVLVEERLMNNKNSSIALPGLLYDKPVEYPHSNIVYTHRCFFENQLPFIGGKLERLCL